MIRKIFFLLLQRLWEVYIACRIRPMKHTIFMQKIKKFR